MKNNKYLISRRGMLRIASAGAAVAALPAVARTQRMGAGPAGVTIAQLFDGSPAQQDVAKDFLVGSRAAWQEINSRGGLKGRPVQHVSIEVDGTPAGVRSGLTQALDDGACIALSGSCGDPVAAASVRQLASQASAIANVAPWLQNSTIAVDERTFPIFAARQEQIAHALRSMTVMGVTEVGAIYASARDAQLYRQDVEQSASALKLGLQNFVPPRDDLSRLGQQLGPGTPALLLFVGGTPELVQFTQGLEKQLRQRYVVALADVNLQTLNQMGAARNTPVIATQAVPMVTASLPIVRGYRDALSRLFDEPPTPLSLAGYIAARYTAQVLSEVAGPLTRASALAAFQRRAPVDLGGYRVSFDPRRRSASFVTQSMLTVDGRVVG